MHIPNGMLQGGICQITAVISVMGIGLAGLRAFFTDHKPSAGKFAAITALIFAGQMMNFPINGGTSGHLLGGVLAVALLGIPFGILSMALVVTIQCLFFSDGRSAWRVCEFGVASSYYGQSSTCANCAAGADPGGGRQSPRIAGGR